MSGSVLPRVRPHGPATIYTNGRTGWAVIVDDALLSAARARADFSFGSRGRRVPLAVRQPQRRRAARHLALRHRAPKRRDVRRALPQVRPRAQASRRSTRDPWCGRSASCPRLAQPVLAIDAPWKAGNYGESARHHHEAISSTRNACTRPCWCSSCGLSGARAAPLRDRSESEISHTFPAGRRSTRRSDANRSRRPRDARARLNKLGGPSRTTSQILTHRA